MTTFPSTYSLVASVLPKPWAPGSDTTALLRILGKSRASLQSPKTVIQYIGALMALFKQYHYVHHAKPVVDPFVTIESPWSSGIVAHGIGCELFMACSRLTSLLTDMAHEKIRLKDYVPAAAHFELAAQAVDLARIAFARGYDKNWPTALGTLNLPELIARGEMLHILAQQCQLMTEPEWIPLALSVQQRFRAIVRSDDNNLPRAMVLFAECHADYWEAVIATHLGAATAESDPRRSIALYNLASQACSDAAAAMEENLKLTKEIFDADFSKKLTTMGLAAVKQHFDARNAWLRDQIITGEDETVLEGAPKDLIAPYEPQPCLNLETTRLVETLEARAQSFLKEVGGAAKLEQLLEVEEGDGAAVAPTDSDTLALLLATPADIKVTRRDYAIALRARFLEEERWLAYLLALNGERDVLVNENDRTVVSEKLKLSLDLIRLCS